MKSTLWIVFIAVAAFFSWVMMTPPFADSREVFLVGRPLPAAVVLSGMRYPFVFDAGLTVAEALNRAGFQWQDGDEVFPAAESQLLAGTTIFWAPVRTIHVSADASKQTVSVLAPTSEGIIAEIGLVLDEDDIVVPAREVTVSEGETIVITRVEIREETKEVKIPFTTKTEEDAELSWRKKIVKQKGENGTKTTTYRVSYHNGKEVNRKLLSTEVTKEPAMEIVTQGTYVKTGKSHRGAASWYAWTGTMAAANPWLPKGSFVKVTNLDNGKSVIVVINDRGPFVPGRIIDLDRVAFEKIASIGAGVINVKMEEIVN